MIRPLEVTVIEADLDAALVRLQHDGADVDAFKRCVECVLAKAVSRTTGAPASVGMSSLDSRGVTYLIPDDACDLITLFDNEAYDVIRQALPVTFVMEAR